MDDPFAVYQREGDPAALAQLLLQQRPAIVGRAFRCLRDQAASEDVAQEVLLRAATARPRFHTHRDFRRWVRTVTLNSVRSLIRTRCTRRSHERIAAEGSARRRARPRSLPPLVGVYQDEIRELLHRLEPELRRPVRLRYFEGLTHARIARDLDLPVGTVASRLRRGVARLRELLEPAGYRSMSAFGRV